jgi:hypothetical protein
MVAAKLIMQQAAKTPSEGDISPPSMTIRPADCTGRRRKGTSPRDRRRTWLASPGHWWRTVATISSRTLSAHDWQICSAKTRIGADAADTDSPSACSGSHGTTRRGCSTPWGTRTQTHNRPDHPAGTATHNTFTLPHTELYFKHITSERPLPHTPSWCSGYLVKHRDVKKKTHPHTWPWRPIGLWDAVEA